MGSIEPIDAKSKGVNQILRERVLRGGEAKGSLKAGKTKVFAGKKTSAKTNETAGTAAKSEPWAAWATDDWFIVLHKGLWDLDFADWQHFIPLIGPISQDFICDMPAGVDALQMPQGVKATITPKIKRIRLNTSIAFRIG
jgi:hypothetical protein